MVFFNSFGPRGFGIILFALGMVIIIFTRPRFLINEETGTWKEFGFDQGKSCYNITFITVILALVSYLITYTIGSLVFSKKKPQIGSGQTLVHQQIENILN